MNKWYSKLSAADRKSLNMISGKLNLPNLNDYESLAHLIHEVLGRISQADCLAAQITKILTGNSANET